MKADSKSSKTLLKNLIQTQAIKHGDFVLKSGAKSSYYIDLRQVTLQSEGLRLISHCLCDVLSDKQQHPFDIDAIGGPCVGADPIVGGMLQIRASHPNHYLRGFLVRKEQKGHGINDLVIGSVKEDDHCVIVEDVTTSGGSLLRACEIVQEFGCTISEVISVVDRNAGANELFEEHNIKFSSLFNIDELL
jgi:orotate phosphoribosyltransferase